MKKCGSMSKDICTVDWQYIKSLLLIIQLLSLCGSVFSQECKGVNIIFLPWSYDRSDKSVTQTLLKDNSKNWTYNFEEDNNFFFIQVNNAEGENNYNCKLFYFCSYVLTLSLTGVGPTVGAESLCRCRWKVRYLKPLDL